MVALIWQYRAIGGWEGLIWDCDEEVRKDLIRFRSYAIEILPLAAAYLPEGEHDRFRQNCDFFERGVDYWLRAVECAQDVQRSLLALNDELGPEPGVKKKRLIHLTQLDNKDRLATISQAKWIADVCRCLVAKSSPTKDAELVPNGIVMSTFQQSIYRALDGVALKKNDLSDRVCPDDPSRLYKPNGLQEMRSRGLVSHKRGLGFYRPDRPPPTAVPQN